MFPLLQNPVVVCFKQFHPMVPIILDDVRPEYRCLVLRVHTMKLLVYSVCAGVNARAGLEYPSY